MSTTLAPLDETQYVAISTGAASYLLQSHRDTVRVAVQDTQPVPDAEEFHELGGAGRESIVNISVDNPAIIWAKAMTDRSSLSVTKNSPTLLSLGDTPVIDAFARLRVSNPETVFDSQLQYDKQPLLWDEWGTGSSVHMTDESAVEMTVASGQSMHRQTFRYHRYQPGKSQLIFCTGVFGSYNSLRFVKRSKSSGVVVDTNIEQANWSNNPLTNFDFTKSFIFYMDGEWLGVGRVRQGSVVDGVPVVSHNHIHAGVESTTYTSTFNLPVRYEIISDGVTVKKRIGYYDDENGFFIEAELNAAAGSMKHICSTVISEGGQTFEESFMFAAETGLQTAGATETPLLAVRPKALFNGIVNRGFIDVIKYVLGVTANDMVFRTYYDPIITGGAWVSADDQSIVEYNATATAFSNGIKTATGYILGGKQAGQTNEAEQNSRYPLTLDHAGLNPKSMLITGQRVGGVDATLYTSTQWREVR